MDASKTRCPAKSLPTAEYFPRASFEERHVRALEKPHGGEFIPEQGGTWQKRKRKAGNALFHEPAVLIVWMNSVLRSLDVPYNVHCT